MKTQKESWLRAALMGAVITGAYVFVQIEEQSLNAPPTPKVASDHAVKLFSSAQASNTALQTQKAILDAYFSQSDPHPSHKAEEIWTLIEQIEEEGQVYAFEALSLKLRWLELNAKDQKDYQARSNSLILAYQNKG